MTRADGLRPACASATPWTSFRAGGARDIDEIASLHESALGKPADRDFMGRCVDRYPSVVACLGGRIVGFAYTQRFAPDVLELCNILVEPALQGMGVGRRLLRSLERAASRRWSSMILANVAAQKVASKLATVRQFYAAGGYELVHETTPGGTVVLIKPLTPESTEVVPRVGDETLRIGESTI